MQIAVLDRGGAHGAQGVADEGLDAAVLVRHVQGEVDGHDDARRTQEGPEDEVGGVVEEGGGGVEGGRLVDEGRGGGVGLEKVAVELQGVRVSVGERVGGWQRGWE